MTDDLVLPEPESVAINLAADELDRVTRPWPANADDGCGSCWWEYRRLSAWVSPLQWTFGIEVQPTTDNGYGGFVVIHLGPLWVALETTRS